MSFFRYFLLKTFASEDDEELNCFLVKNTQSMFHAQPKMNNTMVFTFLSDLILKTFRLGVQISRAPIIQRRHENILNNALHPVSASHDFIPPANASACSQHAARISQHSKLIVTIERSRLPIVVLNLINMRNINTVSKGSGQRRKSAKNRPTEEKGSGAL